MEFSGIRFEFWCFIAHELFKMLVFFDDFLHTLKISVLFDAEF